SSPFRAQDGPLLHLASILLGVLDCQHPIQDGSVSLVLHIPLDQIKGTKTTVCGLIEKLSSVGDPLLNSQELGNWNILPSNDCHNGSPLLALTGVLELSTLFLHHSIDFFFCKSSSPKPSPLSFVVSLD